MDCGKIPLDKVLPFSFFSCDINQSLPIDERLGEDIQDNWIFLKNLISVKANATVFLIPNCLQFKVISIPKHHTLGYWFLSYIDMENLNEMVNMNQETGNIFLWSEEGKMPHMVLWKGEFTCLPHLKPLGFLYLHNLQGLNPIPTVTGQWWHALGEE
jgi:hypothetical protein